jgi:hypothetical protein
MTTLADQITSELRVLIGKPISDCWRAANMQIFEFGPQNEFLNRKGDKVTAADIKLHVQCSWRLVDSERILFGSDDLYRPADQNISKDDFDWGKDDSILDVAQKAWFTDRKVAPLHVQNVSGDVYGGFQIMLEHTVVLEAFPFDSDRGEYSEHWRLLGHRPDGSHFVITGYGVEDDRGESLSNN